MFAIEAVEAVGEGVPNAAQSQSDIFADCYIGNIIAIKCLAPNVNHTVRNGNTGEQVVRKSSYPNDNNVAPTLNLQF